MEIDALISSYGFQLPEYLIILGLGLGVLFFGYKIKKVTFFVLWFLLGFNLVNYFMPFINSSLPEVAASSLYQFLLPIAGGLLLALLGFSIEKVCVGGICFLLVILITIQYFGTEMPTLAVGGILAVIAAGVGVALMKPAIIIATSLAGAYVVTIALGKIIPDFDIDSLYWFLIIGLGSVGAVFQFLLCKKS